MNRIRSRLTKTLVLVFLAVLGLGITYWCCHSPAGPEGVYYDEFIGSSEPTYWVFRGGRAWLREKGSSDIAAGIFVRSNGTWILQGDPKAGVIILKPTPFG